jgi:hypothetical protein
MLRSRGWAVGSLDLEAAAVRTLELVRAEPDIEPGESHYHPASLFFGEAGALLVAFKLAPNALRAPGILAGPGTTSTRNSSSPVRG